jgi:hypothetical protein
METSADPIRGFEQTALFVGHNQVESRERPSIADKALRAIPDETDRRCAVAILVLIYSPAVRPAATGDHQPERTGNISDWNPLSDERHVWLQSARFAPRIAFGKSSIRICMAIN